MVLVPLGRLRDVFWLIELVAGRCGVSEVRELDRRPVGLLLVLLESSSLRSWLRVEEVILCRHWGGAGEELGLDKE